MSRSFFPCSSQKVEMEEMCKELDDLRTEVEALKVECGVKSELADSLKRANGEQAMKLQEMKAETERQAREIVAKDDEVSCAMQLCEELKSKFAEKEQALNHLGAAHEGLKNSLKEKNGSLETEKKQLVAALDESESRLQEQEIAVRSCKEEIGRLRRLLSETEKKCLDAEQRALALKEVRMRDDMLVKLEEEKVGVEGKLKWKTEQFRHLEEALKKVQEEFRAAKREWGLDRSMLVDQINTLQRNLDSKTRVAEEFRWRLEMCSQALAHEESRRKLLEAEMSELRGMYGGVVSDYEEARSIIESLTAKRDGDIASLRSSMAEKVTLLKEMEYCKAQLEQENVELRSSLKEFQEVQIDSTDAAVSLKGMREKFRALEQTHRRCSEKLKDREVEWKVQMEKLGNDLNKCLSQLGSKDMQIRRLRNELLSSYNSLEQKILENWETSLVLMITKSKLYDSCLHIETFRVEMGHHCEKLEEKIAAARKQLEEKGSAITQAQAERIHQSETIAKLHARIKQLECIEQEHKKMLKQLDAYKEMLDNSARNINCLKDVSSEKENGLQEELRKALAALHEANCTLAERSSELSQVEINLHQQKQVVEHLQNLQADMENDLKGYMDENCGLKRDLDDAIIAKKELEETLSGEKEKVCRIIGEQKQVVEHLENFQADMENNLKGYMDENCGLKRDLDDALMCKKEVEESLRGEKEMVGRIIGEKDRIIEGLQQHIAVLEEENMGQKLDVASLVKSEVERSVREVNNRFSEIVEVFDKKLLELETRLSFFEQKYEYKEHEVMQMFDQEEADWYALIAEKENDIADVQLMVESIQLGIKQLLEAAARKLADVQLEIGQLYGFVENLNALNLIQEHDMHFKDMIITESYRELEALELKLLSEKEQSSNLKNALEQLKAEGAAEKFEKTKDHLEIANKLKSLEERKEILEEQLDEFKSRTKALYDVIVQERKEFVDEITGLTDAIGTAVYIDEELMTNWKRIIQKASNEEPFMKSSREDVPNSEKINVKNTVALIRNKSGHLPDRRLPLKEHNY